MEHTGEKIIHFLENPEKIELVKKLGQVIIAVVIVLLIVFFSLLIIFQRQEIPTLIYAICFLCTILVVWGVSGGIEISFGNFKIKKDVLEIKSTMEAVQKDIATLKISMSQESNSGAVANIGDQFHEHYHLEEYQLIDDQTLDKIINKK